VTESGLIALSGLCGGVNQNIDISSFGGYIVYALKCDDDKCVILACGVISDVAAILKTDVIMFLNDFIPNLLEILKN